jgi:hypothetical protein
MTAGLLAGNQHPQLGTSDAVGGRPPSIASKAKQSMPPSRLMFVDCFAPLAMTELNRIEFFMFYALRRVAV